MPMTSRDAKGSVHRYELVERIAVGGMAEVFRAKTYGAHGFEKELAIKRVLPALASQQRFIDRFITEAKIAVSLNHANIVQILDFGRFGESLFIAMEFVDGIDLATLLRLVREQNRRVPLPAALHIAMELCKGLEFAHARGVVHRDISPSNVLLSRAGEVKVADFGIAKAAEGGSGHTRPVHVMGKWLYMSPEQTHGTPLDARSDVFSTAVVLFEMFAGKRPFAGRDVTEIVAAIRELPIPSIGDVRSDIPSGLDEVLRGAFVRDREQRVSTVQLMRALVEFSYAQSVPATSMDLAQLIEELSPQDPLADAETTSKVLIDDIINSELGRKRDPETRHTAEATPPSLVDSPDDGRTTTVLLVPAVTNVGELTEWALETPADMSAADEPTQREDLDSVRAPMPPPASESATAPAPAPRWGAMAAAVIVFVAVAGVALALRGGGETPAGEDATARVVAAESDAGSEPEPEPETRSDAGAEPEPEPEPKAMATVAVGSEPSGARVYIGGRKLGRTPLSTELAAAGSPVVVTLRKRGYKPARATVSVTAGNTVSVSKRLEREERVGTVDLFVKPWANVYFRGKKIAEAPRRGIRLPVGTHKLRLVNPVLKRERTITVTVPSNKPYRVTLPK